MLLEKSDVVGEQHRPQYCEGAIVTRNVPRSRRISLEKVIIVEKRSKMGTRKQQKNVIIVVY
jgi:hypothetical protein